MRVVLGGLVASTLVGAVVGGVVGALAFTGLVAHVVVRRPAKV